MTVLEKLIEFEEKHDVLKFRFQYKNLLLWPYIRSPLFTYIIDYEDHNVVTRPCKQSDNAIQKYIKHNTFQLSPCEVLFVTDSIDLVEQDSKWSDRVAGAYIEMVKERAGDIVCDHGGFSYPDIGRPYVTDNYINSLIEYDAKCSKASEKELAVIREFITFLKNNLPFQLESGAFGFVYDYLETVIRRLPYYYKYYGRLIKKVNPKVVFWNCASYSEPAIKVLNDLGVITAEFQHGLIGRFHRTYNYSLRVANNKEYLSYMPQYYLTYSPFWTKEIKMPCEIIPIGNPWVTYNIEKIEVRKRDFRDRDKNILFVESDFKNKYVDFIKELLSDIDDSYKIFIKIHPSTPQNERYYNELKKDERVSVIVNGSIYEWFARCRYVVGDTSTSLYEAEVAENEVYIIQSLEAELFIDEHHGNWVKNGHDMYNIMKNGPKKILKEGDKVFWTDWNLNFNKFLKDKCNILIDNNMED